MAKTFTNLVDMPSVKIDRCSQILPNKLQCPRSADWLVSDSPTGGQSTSAPKDQGKKAATSSASTTQQPEGKDKTPSSGGSQNQSPQDTQAGQTGAESTYQLCTAHKIIAEQAQKQAAASGKSADEIQAKILGDEENYKLNHMPEAPEEKKEHHFWEKLLKEKHEHESTTTPAS